MGGLGTKECGSSCGPLEPPPTPKLWLRGLWPRAMIFEAKLTLAQLNPQNGHEEVFILSWPK